jgi:hypothetical protein
MNATGTLRGLPDEKGCGMSVEATASVFRHAEGTDAEWRMLAILADAANPAGIVAGLSMEEIAEKVGKTVKGAGQVKRRLIDSSQLVVLDPGGGRGRSAVYWIRLPGLEGPEDHQPVIVYRIVGPDGTLKNSVEPPPDDEGMGADEGHSGKGGSRTEKRNTSSSSDVEAEFAEELRDVEAPDEMIADAQAFLREKRKVNRALVTPREMSCAVAGLATFNRCFEWNGTEGADFGLGLNLTSIVMRVRDHPSWEPAKHVRLVESAWRIRWWERTGERRRPEPNVIYSPKTFDRVAQDAKEEKESGGISRPARKYTRRDRG